VPPYHGDPGQSDLYSAAYELLRTRARRSMAFESPDHTLQPTALVHEVYLRLAEMDPGRWQSRAHLLAVASRAMRRVLIDHARARSSLKRGNGWSRVTLQDGLTPLSSRGAADVIEVIHFDRVLAQLEQQHERMGRVAEMRLFGGMTMDEIAEALGVSKRTVEGDWSFARRWLGAALDGDRPTDAEGDSTNRGT